MGRLDDRLNDHPFRERLTRLDNRRSGFTGKKRKEADGEEPKGTLDRLDTVLEFVEAVVSGSDPRLISGTMLDTADSQLSQLETALDALIDNEDLSHLPSIDSLCDDLLNSLGNWPTAAVFAKSEIKTLAAEFGRSAQSRIESLDRAADDLQDELARIDEKTEAKQAELSEQQKAVEQAVETQQAQVDQAVATGNKKFEVAEAEGRESFRAVAEELTAKAETHDEEVVKKIEAIETDLNEKSGEILTSMEEKHGRVAKLVDLVATSATAGAFGKEAEEQKKEADNWRGHAVKLAFGAAGVALIALLYAIFVETSVTLILTKLAVSVVITGLAGYAARQSAQHRRREIRARRLYLELTAFSPFTEALNDDEKEKEVRAKFIDRLFVGDPQIGDREAGLSKEDISLLNQTADVFKRIRQ